MIRRKALRLSFSERALRMTSASLKTPTTMTLLRPRFVVTVRFWGVSVASRARAPGGGAGGAGSKSVASEVQRCSPRTGALGERWPDCLQLVRVDDVALLEVVEVLQADDALAA